MPSFTSTSILDHIAIVHSGEDFFLRLQKIIQQAQHQIHIQTYLFEKDATGMAIAQELILAARRHVKVFLLIDAFGSSQLPNTFIDSLRAEQINVRFFSPWHSKNTLYLGRRLHHKIVLADAKTILIGGINLSDKYKGSSTELPWLDYAMQIEDSTLGLALQKLCRAIYFKKKAIQLNPIQSSIYCTPDASITILRNDWLLAKNEIYNSYLNALQKATSECFLIGSYFLPGSGLLSALKNASKRGVKISIIFSGKSDLPIVMAATRYLYSVLLRHNIALYEWKKSVLHGKLAIVDRQWVTLGSFNLNHLSSYASIEMNVEVISAEFAQDLRLQLDSTLDACEHITSETLLLKETVSSKITHWFAFRIVRFLLLIATYLPYKRVLKTRT